MWDRRMISSEVRTFSAPNHMTRSTNTRQTNLASNPSDISSQFTKPNLLHTYHGVNSHERKIRFSVNEDEDLIVAGGADKILRMWSLSSGKLVKHLKTDTVVNATAWIPMNFQTGKMRVTNELPRNYNSGFWMVNNHNIHFWDLYKSAWCTCLLTRLKS